MRAMTVTLKWTCPVCGGPRGEPFPSFSYDGSRRLCCDGWINPCGHVDKYDDVRAEAAAGEADRAEPEPASDSDPDYADWDAEYEADMVERARCERTGSSS